MKRLYLVRDEHGERKLSDADLPFSLGGADVADIVVAGLPDAVVVAHIGLSEGHAFVQATDNQASLFHNQQRLSESTWLKSGDQLALADTLILWTVQGDQVLIEVSRRVARPATKLIPPALPPRTTLPDSKLSNATGLTEKKPRLKRRLMVGLFSILLLTALFVLLATPVAIKILPQPEKMRLSGFPPTLSVWGRHLMIKGQYTLEAEREGYYPLRETLAVGGEGFREFSYQLEPLPGHIIIMLSPVVEFKLRVDGAETKQKDDGSFEVKQGKHQLQINSDRYLSQIQEIDIIGFGQKQQLSYTLQPAWADIQIQTEPAGAKVQIDQTMAGITPLNVEILEGLRTIDISLPEFKTSTIKLPVKAGVPMTLGLITLQPQDAKLLIKSTPTKATLNIDGRYYGTTPLSVELAAKTGHTISISKAGFKTNKQTLTLAPAQSQSIDITLRPQYGTIFLSTQPADAQLFVDGKLLGSATQRLSLTTRSHHLDIRKTGYASQQMKLTPQLGSSQSLEIKLSALVPPGKADTSKVAQNKPIKNESKAKPALISADKINSTAGGGILHLISPGGSFMMGASRREAGRRANEHRRKIALTRPYYLGAREISNAQLRQFKPSHRSGFAEGENLDGDKQPVVNLSWQDAALYCNWLSKQEGLPLAYQDKGGKLALIMPPNTGYRLPTEAEWAYATRIYNRAQPARHIWAGSFPPTTVAGNYADARIADTLADVVANYDDGYRGTAPVGSFRAIPPGLYDLGGNVAEWTNDYYTVYPSASQTLERDPVGPNSGLHRVVRGASWRQGNITELRLSYRDYSKIFRDDLGFRIARYAQPP